MCLFLYRQRNQDSVSYRFRWRLVVGKRYYFHCSAVQKLHTALQLIFDMHWNISKISFDHWMSFIWDRPKFRNLYIHLKIKMKCRTRFRRRYKRIYTYEKYCDKLPVINTGWKNRFCPLSIHSFVVEGANSISAPCILKCTSNIHKFLFAFKWDIFTKK